MNFYVGFPPKSEFPATLHAKINFQISRNIIQDPKSFLIQSPSNDPHQMFIQTCNVKALKAQSITLVIHPTKPINKEEKAKTNCTCRRVPQRGDDDLDFGLCFLLLKGLYSPKYTQKLLDFGHWSWNTIWVQRKE